MLCLGTDNSNMITLTNVCVCLKGHCKIVPHDHCFIFVKSFNQKQPWMQSLTVTLKGGKHQQGTVHCKTNPAEREAEGEAAFSDYTCTVSYNPMKYTCHEVIDIWTVVLCSTRGDEDCLMVEWLRAHPMFAKPSAVIAGLIDCADVYCVSLPQVSLPTHFFLGVNM